MRVWPWSLVGRPGPNDGSPNRRSRLSVRLADWAIRRPSVLSTSISTRSSKAQLDGASHWQTFRYVHLPLVRPGLSVLGILYFLWTWNQFLLALVLVSDPRDRTMAGALGTFQSQYGTNIVLLCAAALIIMVPSLLIYLVFQRQFISALLHGGLK